MAKKAAAETVSTTGWTYKTIATYTSGSTTWRTQLSTAPDGKQFLGIRKYIMTKTKGEVVTSTGMNFLFEGTVPDELQAVVKLMKNLCDYVPTTSKAEPLKKRKPTTHPGGELGVIADAILQVDTSGSGQQFGLVNRGGHFLVGLKRMVDKSVKIVTNKEVDNDPKTWATSDEAKTWRTTNLKDLANDWKVRKIP